MSDTFDITQFEGAGKEDLDTQSSMPILRIIQDGSPIVKKSDPNHAEKKIDGAEAGMIVFSNSEVFNELEVVVLATKKVYTAWKDGKPAGHLGLHIANEPEFQKRTPQSSKEYYQGIEVEETNNFFVKFRPFGSEDEWRNAIIPFVSTGHRFARQWSTMIANLKYPDGKNTAIFSAKWKLGTKGESNDRGSWYGWNVECAGLFDLQEDFQALTLMSQDSTNARADASKMLEDKPQLALTADADDDIFLT